MRRRVFSVELVEGNKQNEDSNDILFKLSYSVKYYIDSVNILFM